MTISWTRGRTSHAQVIAHCAKATTRERRESVKSVEKEVLEAVEPIRVVDARVRCDPLELLLRKVATSSPNLLGICALSLTRVLGR